MQSSRRAFLAAAAGSLSLTAQPSRATPNIVLVFCDDLGYADIGPYGSPIRTPHLNRMAAEGVRFTNFYSANPVCSPSRAALLTGRYPTRTGVPTVLFPKDEAGLDRSETTIAGALKSRGYRTTCIGKWHLGHTPDYLPTARGFDEYFGIPYSNDMSPRLLLDNSEIVEREATLETLTPRYTQRAVKFIEQSKGSPFFLYLPHTYPAHPARRLRAIPRQIAAGSLWGRHRRTGLEHGRIVQRAETHRTGLQHARHLHLR
jgi:arylsulfatase A